MSHVTKDREYHESSQETGGRVDGGGNQGVTIDIVVELVVTGESKQNTEPWSEGEKDLCGSVNPNLMPKECQKSTKRVPKDKEKSIRNNKSHQLKLTAGFLRAAKFGVR